ncbi:putative sodium-coupled neutral amino acid transporter 7 [Leptopilina heterotoma]|uniref:putative sodium-coupled neutral amino acid transporter 7 n=1 Tax=Leptopilina heterotoma TaxID=63436 RepID=UPI001CA985C3|nr:putative sodium-coupled neutral amino acid transporter 7 [Leptopilina heterotoma]XP_043473285.1 putative sodium-coupled neutral amino acid transporter 7 [Leptopilina heterotoma]XP_043473287.1 putative sodium-coupled neutral amino acid transporter 7 [Leptopilina heterotoma]
MNCLNNDNHDLINQPIINDSDEFSSATRSSNQNRNGTGSLGTIFLIVNATLGAGLLNFPEAFDKSGGIATAIIVQLFFLIFITSALVVLANCSDITETCTMQNTFAGLCGSKSLILCGVCVAIYSFGCCLTFLIIIGDQFDRVFATFYGLDYCHNWYLSRPFITSITAIVFILPLSFFKRMDVLSYASSIGCLTIIYVVWMVIYESFVNNDKLPKKTIHIWPENLTQPLQIVPIICFAYQSHMTAIPTYACMKDRQLSKFTWCAIISMIICFIAYSIVGTFGYMTFGAGNVPSDILQGYTDKSVTLTLAIIAVAVKNFTTYPIVLYCGRDALMELIGWDLNRNFLSRIILTLIWFFMSLVIAILVPDITPVINLLGSLSAAFIFLFPGICLLQSTLKRDPQLFMNKNRAMIFLAILITALGALVCGIIFVESLQDLFSGKSSSLKKSLTSGLRISLGKSLCV